MTKPVRVSRRRFLQRGAALAASTAAVPYLIPAGVLAAEGRPGANDRIGIGGIGIGRQGSGVLGSALKSPQCRFIGIADVYLPRAQELSTKYGGTGYQDYRRLLERKDVDAIVTATPDHWRALVCIHACQAGKDLYAEKALCLTIREGRLMLEAARKYGRVLQVGSQQRSQAVNRITCEFIRSGKLGKVSRVIGSNYPSPWEADLPAQPVPDGLDWDMWCGPAPYHAYNPAIHPKKWRQFLHYANGQIGDWVHWTDQIYWILGDDKHPRSVSAVGGIHIREPKPRDTPPNTAVPDAPDTLDVHWEFDDCTATWEHHQYADNNHEKARIGCYFYGTKGVCHVG